jgi:hypothetical protein
MPRISRSLDGTANSFRSSPAVRSRARPCWRSNINRSTPGSISPDPRKSRTLRCVLVALSEDDTKPAEEQGSLARIGQAREGRWTLDTRKCLSCKGTDASGGATLPHRFLRRLARAKQRRVGGPPLTWTSGSPRLWCRTLRRTPVVPDDIRGLWPGGTFVECLGAFARKANYLLVCAITESSRFAPLPAALDGSPPRRASSTRSQGAQARPATGFVSTSTDVPFLVIRSCLADRPPSGLRNDQRTPARRSSHAAGHLRKRIL